MVRFRILYAVVLLLLQVAARAQGYPITVTAFPSPPYPVTWGGVSVLAQTLELGMDNSGPSKQVYSRIVLKNEEQGILITSRDDVFDNFCITIPSEHSDWNLTQLTDQINGASAISVAAFDPHGFDLEGQVPQQALPEGSWQLCVQLIECGTNTQLSAPLPAGCVSFYVSYAQRPVLTDICDAVITQENGLRTISWSFSQPASFEGEVQYKLRIVLIDPVNMSGGANQAMLSSTTPELVDTLIPILENTINYSIPDELPLIPGRSYAVRVRAWSPDGDLPVQFNGYSDVCSFRYEPEGADGNGILQAVYPVNDDFIPFRHFPIIAKFLPYRNYMSFDFVTTVKGRDGTGNLPDRSGFDNWDPGGPVQAQSRAMGLPHGTDITEEQAQHLPIYYGGGDPLFDGFSFERGGQYRWHTAGDFTLGATVVHGDTGEEPFKVGMGPGRPLEPEDEAMVPPGDVILRWRTADAPGTLVPPLEVIQAHAARTVPAQYVFFDGHVQEHWDLEVHKDSVDGASIFNSDGEVGHDIFLTGLIGNTEAITTAEEALYKELTATVNVTEVGTYYWQLKWRREPDNAAAGHYNESEVFQFTIGSGGVTTPPANPEPVGNCAALCDPLALPSLTTVGELVVNDMVHIGRFSMKVTDVQGTSAGYSGSATIQVDFLRSVSVMVAFSGLRVNTDKAALAGEAHAVMHDWDAEVQALLGQTPLSPQLGEALTNYWTDHEGTTAQRLVSLFGPSHTIDLPIGMDRMVGGAELILTISAMRFTPTGADLDMVAGMRVPSMATALTFGAVHVCMVPEGLGAKHRAYLGEFPAIPFGKSEFQLMPGSAEDGSGTYMDWDCDGFKCLQVAGELVFSRDDLLPPGAAAGEVHAGFSFQVCEEWNTIIAMHMDPFEATGAPGFIFTPGEVFLDLSTARNPESIVFPEGYDPMDAVDLGGEPAEIEALAATWKGLYWDRIGLALPEEMRTVGGATFDVRHLIYDDQGFTFNFTIKDLVDVNTGRINTWQFSMDSLYMDMFKGAFRKAGMKGRLGMPVLAPDEFLLYNAVFAREAVPAEDGPDPPDGGDAETQHRFVFTFDIDPNQDFTVPMWAATLKIEQESNIHVQAGGSGGYARAELHGALTINTGNEKLRALLPDGTPDMSFDLMRFEDLVIDTREHPAFSCTTCRPVFAMASPQHSVGGFPVTIEAIELSDEQPPSLDITPRFTLGGEASPISAEGTIRFHTSFDEATFRFGMNGPPEITRLHLAAERVGGMTLDGYIDFHHDAIKDEWRGGLAVSLPMGIAGSLAAVFGTKHTVPDADWDSEGRYGYWMVDGMLYFQPAIPIFAGMGIYGFGGGASYHMLQTREVAPSILANGLTTTPANQKRNGTDPPDPAIPAAPSTASWQEDFREGLGLKLAVVLGTVPKESALNMDLKLGCTFTTEGGLSTLAFTGDVFGLASIPDRVADPAAAKVRGGITINYANNPPALDAGLWVDLSLTAVTGHIDAKFHTQEGQWYFYLGEAEPVTRRAHISLLSVAQVNAYIMTGNTGIPNELPPPPALIREILGLHDPRRGLGTEEATSAALGSGRDQGDLDDYGSGAGFAFGAELVIPPRELDLILLYANFEMALGLDINLSQAPPGYVCRETGEPPGNNGWFAQGQIFAGFRGELGVKLPLLFTTLKVPILSMSAAMLMSGNTPHPSGYEGQAAVNFSVMDGWISGTAHFHVKGGDGCSLENTDPLAGIHFIKEVKPAGSGSVFDAPTATFQLPMDTRLEVVKSIDATTLQTTMYVFYPRLVGFDLRKTAGNAAVGHGPTTFSDNTRTMAYLPLNGMLEPHTEYRTSLKIIVEEETSPGVRRNFRRPNESHDWSEDTLVTFHTNELPTVIPPDQVAYTWPIDRQRFFLPGETPGKGAIALRMAMPALFSTTIAGVSYSYVARYIPLGGGEPLERLLTGTSGALILLDLPPLLSERTYVCQIVRRKQNNGGAFGGFGTSPVSLVGASTNLSHFNFGEGNIMNMNTPAGQLAHAVQLGAGDQLLYTFGFRTSKYGSLSQKLAGVQMHGTYPSSTSQESATADVTGTCAEGFDQFDLQGLWRTDPASGTYRLELDPLVRMDQTHSFSDDYIKRLNSEFYSTYLSYSGTNVYNFPDGDDISLTPLGIRSPYLWAQQFPDRPLWSFTGDVIPLSALNDGELENAAYSSPSQSSNTNIGATIPNAFGGYGGSAAIPSVALNGPQNKVQLLYRAGSFAAGQYSYMQTGTISRLNTRTAHNRRLEDAMLQYGPSPLLSNMRRISVLPFSIMEPITSGHEPSPGEFGVVYTANYHVRFYYTTPHRTVIPGAINSSIDRQFIMSNAAPSPPPFFMW